MLIVEFRHLNNDDMRLIASRDADIENSIIVIARYIDKLIDSVTELEREIDSLKRGESTT